MSKHAIIPASFGIRHFLLDIWSLQVGAAKIATLRYKWLNSTVYGRYNYAILYLDGIYKPTNITRGPQQTLVSWGETVPTKPTSTFFYHSRAPWLHYEWIDLPAAWLPSKAPETPNAPRSNPSAWENRDHLRAKMVALTNKNRDLYMGLGQNLWFSILVWWISMNRYDLGWKLGTRVNWPIAIWLKQEQ